MCSQGRQEGGGRGGKITLGTHLNRAPKRESKSLKLHRFYKLIRAFLKLRASYSTSICSLAKV
jgi:hypothetical protein